MSFKPFLIGTLAILALALLPTSFVQALLVISSCVALGIAVATHTRGTPIARLLLGGCAMIAFAFALRWQSFGTASLAIGTMAFGGVSLSEEQMEEFKGIVKGMAGYGDLLKDLKALGINSIADAVKAVPELTKQLTSLRRAQASGISQNQVRWIGGIPFVTDDCAESLTATFVLEVERLGGTAMESLIKDSDNRQRMLSKSKSILGNLTRTALTTTEIPVPTIYAPQIVELVFAYGQARQFATVFPLGAGSVKLPRLKAGEDDFGYLGAGTAGMSQTVTEKRVTAELVTFTANKAGGLIRIPYELEEDTFIPIGQFLARYIARQLAKLEDKTLFLADGSATYASQTGVGPYCAANPTYLLQLAAGKTKPSDATLNDWRNLRSKVSAAVLAGGFDAAYYINPTFEPYLRGFNQYPNFVIFENVNGKPTLDGWPVRWIGVSQAYATTAAASSYIGFFGALNYWYLGTRGQPRVEVSREVFFSTDELAMRALERIDVEALAIDSMAALQTAAS